jgi:tetratricopeptide (TPR) repeat protein
MSGRSAQRIKRSARVRTAAALRGERTIIPLLIVVTLIVFWPAQNHGFLTLDDDAYVYDNPHVTTGLTAANISWALAATHAYNWHPVTWVSHMLDVQIYGLDPGGHHRTNLLFHLANVALLFLILKKITGCAWRSGFVSALFAIHPLQVESVAWVAERKELLSAFFMLLTILAYARYARNPAVRRYVPVILFYALGLMSKPMLVSLPLLLFLLDYWPLARLGSAGISTSRLVAEKAPMFLMAGASSIITFMAQQSGGAVTKLSGYPLGLRVENALVSYARYIGKMLWPAGLALPYPYPDGGIPVWQVAGALLVLALTTYAAIRAAKKFPYFLVGWFWYLVSLVPVIGLVQVGGQAMADRYTYITLIGLYIITAWGVTDLASWFAARFGREGAMSGPIRSALAPLGLIVIVGLAVCARAQVGYWRDSIALFTHTLAVTGDNYLAHNQLGVACGAAGDPRRAAGEFRKAIELAPDYALAHYNLGGTLVENGKLSEAVAEYQKAIGLAPNFYRTYHNLGYALVKLGKIDQAEDAYRDAIRFEPQSGESHWNLAMLQYSKGRYAEAWSEIRLAEQYGYHAPPDFLKALSAQMPDPGPSEKQHTSRQK